MDDLQDPNDPTLADAEPFNGEDYQPDLEPDIAEYPDDPAATPAYQYGEAGSDITYGKGLTQLANGINAAIATKVCKGMVEISQGADTSELKPDFFDYRGIGIVVPKDDGKDYFHIGYAQLLWDLMRGNIFQGRTPDGENDGQIYRRKVDYTSGENRTLTIWTAIDLQSEYGIPRKDWSPAWTRQILFETGRLHIHVIHGIKFNNVAFMRPGSQNGTPVVRLTADDEMFHWPFELTVEQDYSQELLFKAADFARWLTVDDASARNFIRFFATPLLEPYKHLSFVWYGAGGNGKGLIAGALKRTFPDLACTVDAQKLLGGKRGSGGFGTDNEIVKLLGRLWAIDDDADDISIEQMTNLKKISTGDPLSARRIQENTIEVIPKATFLICTNNSVVMSSNDAALRRQCCVRLRDGRKEKDFKTLKAFLDRYGIAPFLMASCQYWQKYGDTDQLRVTIGDFKDLSPAEQWYVDQIVKTGYAVYQDCPFREDNMEHRNAVSKLGLVSTIKRIMRDDGRNASTRVLKVRDEKVFGVYRRQAMADWMKAQDRAEVEPGPDKPLIDKRENLPDLNELGFDCDFVPAGDDKVAKNWQRKIEDPGVDTKTVPTKGPYGIVPGPDCVVVDIDRSKHEGVPDGWTLLNNALGPYGTIDFPKTYLVRTPSGGYHAYYRIPEELRGILKNIAHPSTPLYDRRKTGGVPVDTRCSRRGYVVGPTSEVKAGAYTLVDLPPKNDEGGYERIPELSDAMVEWLKRNNYVDLPQPKRDPLDAPSPWETPAMRENPQWAQYPPQRTYRHSGRRKLADMNLDLSPVAEGARNDTLFRWACGLMSDHSDEAREIERLLFQRGRASGLHDSELEQIWKSVNKQLKK